ncbi:MAG: hypothetical protein RSB38_00440, partial [Oscillospiraceae bacterium]
FITRKDACELIDKALGIDILKRETYGEESSEYSVKDGYNLLYETFKIIEENGIVTGAGKNTLTGPASYKANQIEVDGKVFNTDIVNAKDYLGYSVKYYYKDKNDGIIIRIDKRNINKELAVKAQDVTDFNYTKIEYENMGKNKKVSVSTKADFLMNDRVVAFKEPMMDYFKNDGYVKLIDNNGDSSYDVVMLNTYTNMVVDTKDSKNMIIVDKYKENRSSQINKSHSFEINDYDDISYCFENGNVADFEDINEWDILSLFESQDKRCLKVVVGRDKVTGSVKEIINNGETQKIIIDNKAYEISKDYQTRGDIEIYPGMEGTFYLDRSKKIAAIYSNETDRIGYLLNASKAGGLDDDKFRIVTSTGETVDYAGSDKMTLNAEEQLSSQKIIERLTLPDGKIKSQMISYRLAGGKIKKIYTAGIGSDTEKIFTQQYAEGLKYHGGSKIVGGKIAINENTLLFNIPTQDDLARGDKATVSKAASALGHFQVYPDLISVKTTKNQIESDALCLVGADNTGYIPEFDPLMIVSAINEAVNEKGEQIKNIKLIKNGKEIEFLTAKEDTLKNVKPAYESFTGTYEIGVGDIIRCSINSKNELTYAVLYFDASSKSMLAPNPNVDYLGRPRLYYANIYDKQGKFLKVTTNDPSAVVSDAECEIQGIKRIYIVDPKNTKKPIDEGSYVDLKSYLGDGSNYT